MSERPATTDENAAALPFRYDASLAADIESRWQDRWEAEGTFEAPNPAGPMADPEGVAGRDKLFVLDMFPYPSGKGLHVGHPLGYIGTDVYARFQRMAGKNVVHALGYDAFGLPAEQHAITTGVHPRVNTEENIATMRRQLRRLGLGHDARRSVATTDESFFKWTQWIFLQIFNAWYDTDADKARPIAELEAEFAAGSRPTPGGRAWADLSATEQADLIDGHRLAYLSDAPVNWCPGLGTILANEEVTAEGRSDIGNYPVFQRTMRQWMLAITAYADRLIADLDLLDWPEPIKIMQRNWIGRSEGAEVDFSTPAGPLRVFTTRPDTLFGATFMVVAPEHPMVDALTTDDQRAAVTAYQEAAAAVDDRDRTDDTRTKTGVPTGGMAINPLTGEEIPVWIADYVLMGYGTGAIMAVPCGDQRDFEFATKFALPIVPIQSPPDSWFEGHGIEPTMDTSVWPEAFVGDAPFVNSSNDTLSLEGISDVATAVSTVVEWLEANELGNGAVTYRLRDWLFSRQRYWGEPFPIAYDESGRPHALPAESLPVTLPELEDFSPEPLDPDDDVTEPRPPLARADHWVSFEADLGDGPKTYIRDLNVMPQWAGSCWYQMRYLDPTNEDAFIDPEVEAYWLGPKSEGESGGVDLYVGGVEHAVLHLLYARFWHKVLFDLGHVTAPEPYGRLFNQGYIQAAAYRDERGQPVEATEVVEAEDGSFTFHGDPVTREFGKMGKSLKNMVTPDDMYAAYGADTFRLYQMASGPLDASRPWNTRDVVGMHRFLQRVWRNVADEATGESIVTDVEPSDELLRRLHRTIDSVRGDFDGLRMNTAVAKLIELNNELTGFVKDAGASPRAVIEPLTLMLAPLAPHLAEEIWNRLDHADSLTHEPFPVADPALLVDDTVEYPIQVNGKVRSRITVAADADQAAVQAAALADERIVELLGGGEPRKVIVVPGRMVNIVA